MSVRPEPPLNPLQNPTSEPNGRYTRSVTTIDDIRAWFADLSLASKCLLLFGGASALIITIALSLPLLRMNGLIC